MRMMRQLVIAGTICALSALLPGANDKNLTIGEILSYSVDEIYLRENEIVVFGKDDWDCFYKILLTEETFDDDVSGSKKYFLIGMRHSDDPHGGGQGAIFRRFISAEGKVEDAQLRLDRKSTKELMEIIERSEAFNLSAFQQKLYVRTEGSITTIMGNQSVMVSLRL